MSDQTKLHLACGPHIVDGWVNIDILEGDKIVHADLRAPLPYEDNTVDAIFHEHFIEHLVKLDGEKFLAECYRVLKPGAAMRMGWPDLARLINAYNFRRKNYRDYVLPHLENHKYGADWDEIFTDCLFSWEHRCAYTANHMAKILKTIGFSAVHKKKYKDSDFGIALDFRNDPATTFLEVVK